MSVSLTSPISSQSKSTITKSRRRVTKWALGAFVGLLLISATARIATFRRYLPYTDYSDESNYFMLGLDWRDTELAHNYGAELIGEWLGSYPPLYIWLNMAVQRFSETASGNGWLATGEYIAPLRVIAVLLGILTTALIAGIGTRTVGPLAGWLAGLIWALSPIIVETNNLAIPDGLVYPSVAGAILTAIWAWQSKKPIWTVISLICAIAAIYAKYVPIYGLIPWAIMTLMLTRHMFKKMLPWLAVEAVIAATSGFYVLYGLSTVGLQNQEADWTRTEGLARMFTLARNVNNWQIMIFPIGATLMTVALVGGIVAYVISRRAGWRTVNLWWIAFVLISTLPAVPVSAQISNLSFKTAKIRFVIMATVGMMVLWGAALTQIVWALQDWYQTRKPLKAKSDNMNRLWRFVPAGLLIVVLWIWGQPAVARNAAVAREFDNQNTIVHFWQWSDANMPADGMVMSPEHSYLNIAWNRPWSGYDGITPFQWWVENIKEGQTPQQYVERGITYFTLTNRDLTQHPIDPNLPPNPAIAALTKQLTLVKTVAERPGVNGPTIYLYRMLPPQVATDVTFAEQIRLTGYDLKVNAADKTLTFRPYFNAPRRPDNNYSMFIHLYPQDKDEIVAQFDGPPTTDRALPLTWDDPDELHIGAQAALKLPETLAPGTYRLILGLYNYETGQRLMTDQGKDAFTVEVVVP
jgi:hypothetical protein